METFSFGLIVAYLLPGFVGLVGLAPLVPTVDAWLNGLNLGDAGISPSLYVILAATTVGMIVSCFRWAVIDTLHRWTGLRQATKGFDGIEKRLDAVQYLVEQHYRYYQFYSNILVAIVWAYIVHRVMKTSALLGPGTDLGVVILCAVLFAGSRDTLAKYRGRVHQMLD
jgi:hypothetical protein